MRPPDRISLVFVLGLAQTHCQRETQLFFLMKGMRTIRIVKSSPHFRSQSPGTVTPLGETVRGRTKRYPSYKKNQ